MRVARVVLATGLVITSASFCMRGALAGGTNGARAEGIKLYQAGHFEEALLCFDEVLSRHSRDLEILIKRGVCYVKLDKPEKALADFDRVNRHTGWASGVFAPNAIYDPNSTWLPLPITDPNFAESWGNRGIALLMLDRNEEALESFRTAISLWNRPQNSRYVAGLRSRVFWIGPVLSPTRRRPDRAQSL